MVFTETMDMWRHTKPPLRRRNIFTRQHDVKYSRPKPSSSSPWEPIISPSLSVTRTKRTFKADVKSKVFAAVKWKNAVFWNLKEHRLAKIYRYSGENRCLRHLHSGSLPHYTKYPFTGMEGCLGFRVLRLPEFLDIPNMKVTRFSALRTNCVNPPGHTPGTHFC